MRATVIGLCAILLWATLALLTTGANGIPPFELLAFTFAVGFTLGALVLLIRGGRLTPARQPGGAWLLGVAGLFGYHFFYFVALANAPAVDASLIAYLWPLLIVLFSALLPGERLRWFHLAGAVAAFAGAGLLITRDGGPLMDGDHLTGYLAATACAFIWSSYSVLNRRYRQVPTSLVTYFCGIVALLGAASHALLESFVVPTLSQWAAIVALGVGPVGAAFFLWDHGTKHGNIQVLGVSSYAAPLISTLLLVAFGKAAPSPVIAAACALIVGGALLASRDLLRTVRPPS